MYRQEFFAPGEWYHIYNRGIDRRIIFEDKQDFQRFKKLLFLANGTKEINLELLKELPYEQIFNLARGTSPVAIGAYCLMDNHPHLVLQEKEEGGISTFMRTIGIAYTMYFNRKHDRIGNLMIRPFKAKHISSEGYLQRVVQYVHLNPAEIFEPAWKSGKVSDIRNLEQKLLAYPHSSLPEYFGTTERPERAIIDPEVFLLLSDNLPALASVLADAREYYEQIEKSFESKVRGRPKKMSSFT
jgi:REP element-mobilizing transposase RayT